MKSGGWRAGAIPTPSNESLRGFLHDLQNRFPVVKQHRRILNDLGSQIVHAQRVEQSGLQKCSLALVRFSGAIEAAFGLTREVVFFYSPYSDLQIREIEAAKQAIRNLSRDVTPDVMFVWSPDVRGRQKLDDWSKSGLLLIPLASVDSTDPVAFISLLRDFIYARDLFYESTPVHGDRFFGRRQLLRSMRDDINNQRVVGLFGLRKAGKTSVLSQLLDEVSGDQRIVILRDLESLPSPPDDPIPGLIKDLVFDLQDQLRAKGLRHRRQFSGLGATPDSSEFRRAMQASLRFLANDSVDVVLMLDEIEYLTPSDRVDVHEGEMASIAQFLGALRSLVQENRNFTFILSGLTSSIVESGRLFARPNPLFSWAKSNYLAPFTRDEADELAISVGGRMGIDIDDGALEAFFEATGGHAFLYRSLASAVVQSLPTDVFQRTISRADVLRSLDDWKRKVAGNIDEMVSHVKRYYGVEAILLDILQNDPEEFHGVAGECPSEVQHLLSLGLIEHRGNEYQMATVLELL